MVAGLETPTEGRIRIEDEDVTGYDPREGHRDGVPELRAVPHMTVKGNMSFPSGSGTTRTTRSTAESTTPPNSSRSTISSTGNPRTFSGGQQQRVALGRAIVREPSVFLMDEPLSNLDAKLRVQMRTELNEIHQRVGKTTIYVTHDQAEAMTLGDRVVVLNDGKLQQIGPPQYLYDNPVNLVRRRVHRRTADELPPGGDPGDWRWLHCRRGVLRVRTSGGRRPGHRRVGRVTRPRHHGHSPGGPPRPLDTRRRRLHREQRRRGHREGRRADGLGQVPHADVTD